MPLKSVFLAEWFNSDKENANGENTKGALHARIQARNSACSETLFGSLKVERLHGQRLVTRCQAKDEAVAWLLWHNQARLHATLACVSPMQFESEWLAKQAIS